MKAILFDFGGTLDTNGLHWSEKFWSVYQDYDVPISKGEFEVAYVAAESTMANRGVAASCDLLRTLKDQVDLQFEELHKSNLLRSNVSSELPSLVARTCCKDVQKTVSDLRPLLLALGRKLRLALVSNFYGNLDTVCRELEIAQIFSAIIDSAVVGIRKPDPRIFEAALDGLHIAPSQATVVGDSYERDIVPAKSIGCGTIWLRGKSWQTPQVGDKADFIINRLEEIPEILKISMPKTTSQC